MEEEILALKQRMAILEQSQIGILMRPETVKQMLQITGSQTIATALPTTDAPIGSIAIQTGPNRIYGRFSTGWVQIV